MLGTCAGPLVPAHFRQVPSSVYPTSRQGIYFLVLQMQDTDEEQDDVVEDLAEIMVSSEGDTARQVEVSPPKPN